MQVLVELAMERDEDIPALIYEARPTVRPGSRLSWLAGQHHHALPYPGFDFKETLWDDCRGALLESGAACGAPTALAQQRRGPPPRHLPCPPWLLPLSLR